MKEKIDELMEKYFEGNTTCEEERTLRHFFTHETIPPDLASYRPLFAYIEQEAEKHRHAGNTTMRRRKTFFRPSLHLVGSIAAGIALCIGFAQLLLLQTDKVENFVVIDGKHYTDPTLIEAKARESLHNVSFSQNDLNQLIFPIEP